MFTWIKKFFQPKVIIEYKIVELSSPRMSNLNEKELRDSISTLAAHPGFIALTQRLLTQSSFLETKLKHERHDDMRKVDFLQAGVYWSNWLSQEVRRATTKISEFHQDAMKEELEAFNEINSTIERVG